MKKKYIYKCMFEYFKLNNIIETFNLIQYKI